LWRSQFLRSHQVPLVSDLKCLAAVIHIQFAVDGAEVIAHGAGRDVQRLGDLLVGQIAFRQAQDLELSVRK
jgi:hypothetical protein